MNRVLVDLECEAYEPQVTVLKMTHKFMINYNYLIVDPVTLKAVIVDPAWEMDKVDQALIESGATLSGILLTHSHPDHIHLAKPLAAKYDCPIWMSHQEIATSNFDAEQLIGIDEKQLKIGSLTIQPIYTPGHTKGCFCYLIGDNLFTGDVLFAEGCGMCPGTEAAHAMFDSLEYLKTQLKPETRIFPGHSYGQQPGRAFSKVLKENIYLQFDKKETFAAFRLRKGQKKSSMFSFR